MVEQSPPISARQRRTWRRWLLAAAVLCAVIATTVASVAWYQTRPDRLAARGQHLLSQWTGTEAQVRDARIIWREGTVVLEGVSLRVPDLAGAAGELFETEAVHITTSPAALLSGGMGIEAVRLVRPKVHITELGDTGRYNFHHLTPPRTDGDVDRWLSRRLPALTVNNAAVRVGHWRDEALELSHEMRLAGQVLPIGRGPTTYRLSLHQLMPEGRTGSRVNGLLDPHRRQFAAQISEVRITDELRGMMPRFLRQWWDRVEPAGSLGPIRLSYEPKPGMPMPSGAWAELATEMAAGLRAELEFEGGAFTLPMERLPIRPHDISGRLVLEDEKVHVESLSGRFGELRYHLAGVVDGLDAEAPMELSWRIAPVTLPENIELSPLLPQPLLNGYQRFEPAGRFQAQGSLRRAKRGAELDYSGVVDVLEASGQYYRFPYPLRDVRGRILFDRERVVLERITGRGPNGGLAVLEGAITPPQRGADIRLTIRARDLPADELLFQAIPAEQRRIVEMFCNRSAYQRLAEAGAILADQRAGATVPFADGMAPEADTEANVVGATTSAPSFALGGRLNGEVRVHRPAGINQSAEVGMTIEGGETQVLFEHWPYPLRVVSGRIDASRDHVRVRDVRVRGLTGAEGVIRGQVTRDESNGELMPDLTIEAAHLPVDDLLAASIPEPQDQWLEQMHIEGGVTGTGRVFRNEAGEIDFAVEFHLEGESGTAIEPFGAGMRFERLAGVVELQRGSLALREVSADHAGGSLTATGKVDWAADEPAIDLRFDAHAMPIDAGLLDMIPPGQGDRGRLTELFDTYQPTGRFDGTLVCRRDGEPEESYAESDDTGEGHQAKDAFAALAGLDYTLSLRPRELAFDLHQQRIELQRMDGEITAERSDGEPRLMLDGLHGSFEHGEATLAGVIHLNEPIRTALQLQGRTERVDETVLAVMPEPVRRLLERMEVDGGFYVEAAELTWQGSEDDGDPHFAFDARLLLEGLSMDLGLSVEELYGTVDLRYGKEYQRPRAAGEDDVSHKPATPPQMELDLRAEHLRVADRHIGPLRFHIDDAEEPGILRVRRLDGRMYGGIVTGEGYFEVDPEGSYLLDLAIQNVRFTPMVDPSTWVQARRSERNAETGADATEGDILPVDGSADAWRRPDIDAHTAAANALSPGMVDASLTLEGRYDPIEQRRGRGEVRVRDARLFDRPLDMALLQAINLALPVAGGFDGATVSYLLEGKTVWFETIRLQCPTILITGTGTMELPEGRLNLALCPRNPASDAFGPLGNMLDILRDELIAIEVNGTLDAPEVRVVSLTSLRDTWQRVFE